MKRWMGIWQLFGFAITSFGGTLLHFLYDWLNRAIWIAPFSGINESTWEHMKLLFWPMFIFAIIQSFFYKNHIEFWGVKLKAILLGLGLIPVIFYTYNGVIGKSPDWVNIAIFFIAAGIAYIFETKAFYSDKQKNISPTLAFILICVIAMLFVLFSFHVPDLNIFKDPLAQLFCIGNICCY